jgi:hypothetical protein
MRGGCVTPHAAQKIKGSAGSHDLALGYAVSQMKRSLVIELEQQK